MVKKPVTGLLLLGLEVEMFIGGELVLPTDRVILGECLF